MAAEKDMEVDVVRCNKQDCPWEGLGQLYKVSLLAHYSKILVKVNVPITSATSGRSAIVRSVRALRSERDGPGVRAVLGCLSVDSDSH